ncbi:FAD-dependent monooxygenase [Ktedonobacter sp. SOSP1-85]|uniref:FAD-dependent monooxygenase n=1 Tax=Ktedonobacter sp. SOSP1-85 TaxID=2778367 RepID=UPI001916984C|nr:FAD-dependent monooxygenase [Ktedonobacter sp. SOSP1-85]GHO77782.1 FAD-dependent monooxygenase [Ktedonobacter sp. SOSP1-85]
MTTQEQDFPILIIGAGIGGLATALALQQAGFAVQIFERTKEIRESGSGLTLWANAVRVLQELGLADLVQQLAQQPAPTRAGFYTMRGKQLVQLPPRTVEEQCGGPTIAIHRAEFQAALRERLAPDTLVLDKQLIDLEQDTMGVTACFARGERVRGSLLIGADGIRSQVRQLLFPQSQPRYAGYTAWRGIATGVTPPLMGELWGCGRRFGIVPLAKERVYWYATCNSPENAAERPEGRQKELLDLFKGWHPVVSTLINATEASTILRNEISDLQPLTYWSKGRVTLLGDAAHAMTPNMGQGACQALEDALILARTLRHAHSQENALDMYQQKRLARANMVVVNSHRMGLVAQWEHPLACWLRDSLLALTPPQMLLKQFKSVASYTWESSC